MRYQKYDRTFNGKKARNVRQDEIDNEVNDAHGPDSVPRRTTDPSTSPNIASFEDFPHDTTEDLLKHERSFEAQCQSELPLVLRDPPPTSSIQPRRTNDAQPLAETG